MKHISLNVSIWHNQMMEEISSLDMVSPEHLYDSVPFNPLVLKRTLYSKLQQDIPKIFQLARKISLTKFEQSSQIVDEDFLETINIHKNLKRLPIIGRGDGVLVNNQLKLIELNIDSGIGGIWEMDFLQTRFANNPLLEQYKNYELPNPKQHLMKFVEELRNEVGLPSGSNLGLLARSDYNEIYQGQAYQMCEWITEHTGFQAYFVNPEQLNHDGRFVCDNQRNYHFIYKDSWLWSDPYKKTSTMLDFLKNASKTETIVFSDSFDLLIESKRVLSLLIEEMESKKSGKTSILTNHEADLIKDYLPWTKIIRDENLIFQNQEIGLIDLILNQKNNFVIKKCNSYAGKGVYIGQETNQERWKDLVFEALNTENSAVVQENLFSDQYDFLYQKPDNTSDLRSQRFVLSPYVFGEKLGGLLLRIESDTSRRVLAVPSHNNISCSGVIIVD